MNPVEGGTGNHPEKKKILHMPTIVSKPGETNPLFHFETNEHYESLKIWHW